MATLNPLLDTAPATNSFAPPGPQFEAAAAQQPNLLFGLLRRWPWLLLGLATGLVLGLLYHMQRAPVYQSGAQLLVIKNRPELTASGGMDARVSFVEDYVATQVLYLRSERILELAARRLDEYKPFQVPPPATESERVGFLMSRFAVVREKEPGSTTLSNILQLSFKAAHPADAPKYLRAIIEAYRADLATVYTGASEAQLKQLTNEIDSIKRTSSKMDIEQRGLERELRGAVLQDDKGGKTTLEGISQEELSGVRSRIGRLHDAESSLLLRAIVVKKDLDDIEAVGNTRSARLVLMRQLGIQPDRPPILGGAIDPTDLDAVLATLKFKRDELALKFGEGHPEMKSLNNQIDIYEKEIKNRGGPLGDEIDRHRLKLVNEQQAINEQLKRLRAELVILENTARRMGELQDKINEIKAARLRDDTLLRDKERERDRVNATKESGGYKVEDITKPSEGGQIAPVLTQSLLLGAVVGLLLGCGLGLWAELADRSFRSPADIRRALGLSVLGHVPPIRTNEPPEHKPVAPLDPVLVVLTRPHSAEAEAVRGIRTQILFNTKGREHQVLQITSPNPGDGKSTLAANLAISLAKTDKRVVLVDCDFRKPRVHHLFALAKPDLGLASVVADQADLGDTVQGCEVENLSLLPCGPRPANPAELLTTPKFQEILNDLRSNYDYVILDTPPVLAVSDPAAVAPRADGVILVFRMTKEARPAVTRATDDLVAVGGKLLGVIVNASTEREMGYGYGYSYRYDYQYTETYADPK